MARRRGITISYRKYNGSMDWVADHDPMRPASPAVPQIYSRANANHLLFKLDKLLTDEVVAELDRRGIDVKTIRLVFPYKKEYCGPDEVPVAPVTSAE